MLAELLSRLRGGASAAPFTAESSRVALAAVIAIDPDRNLAPATLAVGGVVAFLAYRRAVRR